MLEREKIELMYIAGESMSIRETLYENYNDNAIIIFSLLV